MKPTGFCLICLAIVTVILTVSQQTSAQFTDNMGVGWNNAMSASASTMIWNSIFYRTAGAGKGTNRPATGTRATSQPSRTSQPVKPTNPNAVKFRPTGTYIKTRELADSLASTPAEREQYQTMMNTVLDAFGQQMQKAGFQNDVAAALAYFLGENIRIYRGMPDLSDQQFLELRNNIADAIVAGGAVSNMTDRQKQELYETLVAYTGLTQYGYEQGIQSKNDAIIRGYQKVAGRNLLDVTKKSPDDFNIGPNGLSMGSDNSRISP